MLKMKVLTLFLFVVLFVAFATGKRHKTHQGRKTQKSHSSSETSTTENATATGSTEATTTAPPTDYCMPELCPRGKKHIACNNTGIFHKSCPANNTEVVDLTAYTRLIVHAHNDMRNQLAAGQLQNLHRAARMATMSWSDELANVASFNAKICEAKHDDCRNTPKFRNAGQNIALFNLSSPDNGAVWKKLYPDLVANSIRAWWNESAKATNEIMMHFPKEHSAIKIRHFGVMAWENNTDVGCAAVHYMQRNITYFKLTCNYAVNYIPGQQVYHFLSNNCQSGYNANQKYLCSPKEVY